MARSGEAKVKCFDYKVVILHRRQDIVEGEREDNRVGMRAPTHRYPQKLQASRAEWHV
eukprot:COSAG01_NODE_33608_length_561_cov_1.556277_1_plen_58_part_00